MKKKKKDMGSMIQHDIIKTKIECHKIPTFNSTTQCEYINDVKNKKFRKNKKRSKKVLLYMKHSN